MTDSKIPRDTSKDTNYVWFDPERGYIFRDTEPAPEDRMINLVGIARPGSKLCAFFEEQEGSTDRATLLEQLVTHAYKFNPDAPFLLASGAYSQEYLDCKLALSQPAAMAALGHVFLGLVPSNVRAIGGLTMGADPIAMSACQASAHTTHELRWFTVRKEPKAHGQKKLIEGAVDPGDVVTIVDDVVTTGMSTVKAIEACRSFGLEIANVIVLVDREESNGLATIRNAANGIDVHAIFRKSEIQRQYKFRKIMADTKAEDLL